LLAKDSDSTSQFDVPHDHILGNAPSLESNDFDILSYLEVRVQDCISNNAPAGIVNSLRALLLEFIDIFRISLCSDHLVKVTPLILKQSSPSVPVLANSRVMPAVARDYMLRWVSELEQCGLICTNRNPTWALPPFLVDPFKKPRMVIDMVPANKTMVK
jgi:hypothetical protein